MDKQNDNKSDKPTRKRKENYEEKLKINGTLFDVLKVAVTPKPKDGKEKENK